MKKSFLLFTVFASAILFMGQGCISVGGGSAGTTGPAGMFASIDKGDSWQQISLLPQADGVKTLSDVSVYRMATDPGDPGAIYWSSRAEGMFFSYSDGKTWQQPAAPLNTGFIYSVAVSPENKCLIYATNGAIVYRSDDCNRSWKETYRESGADDRVVSLAFNPFSPHQIFMGKSSGDLLQSFNSGVSWNVVNRFGKRVDAIAADLLQERVLYVATRSAGLYRSRDGGVTWDNLVNTLSQFPGALEFRRFYMHPTRKDTIYWISTYGILVSADGGDNWTPMDLINPPGSANVYAFAINPKNDKEIYYTATVNNRSTFYQSTDGGKNWITKKLPTGQIPTALRVHPVKDNIVYIGFTIPPKE